MISCFGTYTKGNLASSVWREEALIFSSHSGSVSAVLQWIVSSARQSGHMDLSSPHMHILFPLCPVLQQCGRDRAESLSWLTPELYTHSSTCSQNWSLNNTGRHLFCLNPAHLTTHSCAQVKKDLLGMFKAVFAHWKSQQNVMASKFLQLLPANSCISWQRH